METESKTLGDALDELQIAEYTNGSTGRYIISINGMMADESNEEWWGFDVNDEFAQAGIDATYINEGDRYTFIFHIGYE